MSRPPSKKIMLETDFDDNNILNSRNNNSNPLKPGTSQMSNVDTGFQPMPDLIEMADIGDFIDLSCSREETSLEYAVEEELRMRREQDAARIVKQQFTIPLDSLELEESFFTKIKQMFSVIVQKDIQAKETKKSKKQWLSATGKHDDVQKAQKYIRAISERNECQIYEYPMELKSTFLKEFERIEIETSACLMDEENGSIIVYGCDQISVAMALSLLDDVAYLYRTSSDEGNNMSSFEKDIVDGKLSLIRADDKDQLDSIEIDYPTNVEDELNLKQIERKSEMFRATAASKYREDEYELLRSCGTKHGYSEEEIKEAFDCFQTIPTASVFVRKLHTNRDRKIHMNSSDTVFSLSDDTTRANYKPTIDFVALNEDMKLKDSNTLNEIEKSVDCQVIADPANVLESSCGNKNVLENKNDQRTRLPFSGTSNAPIVLDGDDESVDMPSPVSQDNKYDNYFTKVMQNKLRQQELKAQYIAEVKFSSESETEDMDTIHPPQSSEWQQKASKKSGKKAKNRAKSHSPKNSQLKLSTTTIVENQPQKTGARLAPADVQNFPKINEIDTRKAKTETYINLIDDIDDYPPNRTAPVLKTQPVHSWQNVDGSKTNRTIESAQGKPNDSNLRYVVIDGSNVAMSHGNGKLFSCRGIKIVVQYFKKRGHHQITAFVPQWRRQAPRGDKPTVDQHILEELRDEGVLVFTPSRKVEGRNIVSYDDRFILRLAHEVGGIIVSTDNYRDLYEENRDWRDLIAQRLLPFSFVGDIFMPPDDPLGRFGPTLDQFLSCPPSPPQRSQNQFASNWDPVPSCSGYKNKPGLLGPGPMQGPPSNRPQVQSFPQPGTQQQFLYGQRANFQSGHVRYNAAHQVAPYRPNFQNHVPGPSQQQMPKSQQNETPRLDSITKTYRDHLTEIFPNEGKRIDQLLKQRPCEMDLNIFINFLMPE